MALTRPKIWNTDTRIESVQDPMTVLNAGATQANVDVGFLMNRANGLLSNVAIYWNEAGNTFVTAFTSNSGGTDANVTVTSYANVTTGSLIPGANVSYDLGSPTHRWKTLYISGSTIVIGSATISADDDGNFNFSTGSGSSSNGQFATVIANTVNSATIGNTDANIVGTGTYLTNLTGAQVTGTVASATTAQYVTDLTAANVQGVIGSVSTASFPTLNQNTTGTASTVTDASQPSITTLAGLTSFGTAGVDTTAQGNLTITGNLTVQGTQTTINNTTYETTEYVNTTYATNLYAATIGNTGAQGTFGNITTTNGIFWANGNPYNSTTSTGAGNITVSGSAISLTATGPGATTVGSSTAIPIITTDPYGRVVGLTSSAVSTTINLAGTSVAGATLYSYYFNGSSGLKYPTSTNLEFGSGDFTIEFWMNAGSSQTTYATITDSSTNNTGTIVGIGVNVGGNPGHISFKADNNVSAINSTALVNDNTWHHIACVKSGSNGYVFVDGSLSASTNGWSGVTNAYLSNGELGRSNYGGGSNGDNTYTGYLSNFRIVKGTALYTSNFTVPSLNLTAVSGTQLLTLQNATVVDNSTNSFSLTTVGTAPAVSTTPALPGSSSPATTGNVSGGGTLTFASTNGVTVSVGQSYANIATPQDIQTTASPTFGNATINGTIVATTVNAVTIGNISANHVGTGTYLTNLTGAQVTGTVANATTAQYITGLTASNVTTALGSTAVQNSTNAVTAQYVTGLTAANVQGVIGSVSTASFPTLNQDTTGTASTVTASSQSNITSVGTLTGLTSSGIVSVTNNTDSTSTGTGALQVTGGAGIGGNLWIGGNLYVANIFSVTTQTLTVDDPLVYFRSTPSGDPGTYNYDIGFYSAFNGTGGQYQHTGVTRAFASNTWIFFSNVASEPTTTINWNDTGILYDSIKAGALTLANTTDSSSTTTGALIVAGGAGINGNVFATALYSDTHNYANGISILNSVNSSIAGANAAIITANTLLKSYVDDRDTSITNAWTANAASQQSEIVTLQSQVYNNSNVDAHLSSTGSGNITISSGAFSLTATGPGATSVGSSTAIPVITTDAYGRVSTTSTAAVVAPAGTLTGSTLASGVTSSSLTSVGTLTGLTSSGAVQVTNSTASTSTSTGALTVSGGAGIAGNIYVGAVYTTTGLFWAANNNVISTGGGGGSAPGGLTGQIQYNNGGTLDASGLYYYSANSAIVVTGETASSSTTTGQLQVLGGAGITGNLNVGGAFTAANITTSGTSGNISGVNNLSANTATLAGTTTSTSTTTGALTVGGGVGISGNVVAGGQVRGTYGLYSTGAFNGGYSDGTVIDYTTGTGRISVGSSDALKFYSGGPAVTETLVIASTGNVVIPATTTSTSTTTGALTVGGGAGVAGNLYVGGNSLRGGKALITNYTGSTAPSSPQQGDEWWYTTGNVLYKYINDGTTSTWVNINSSLYNASTSATATTLALRDTGGNLTATNFLGVASSAKYADLAEIYVSDSEYTPATVVVFGGEQEITVTTESHDPRVAGVISTNPAYLMNSDCVGLPVAFTGRVPCFVKGPVTKGQLLVTSDIPGVAQAINNSKFVPGCVIGKALENILDDTITTIEVVVGRF